MLELSRRLQAASLLAAVLGVAVAQSDFTPALSHSTPNQLIFGPKQYLRTTGSPNQFTDTFTVPTSISAPFLLHLVKGDANEDDDKDEEKDRDEAGTLRVGKLAHARAGHTATLLADGTVLLTGGRDKHRDILDSAEVLDPTTLHSALLGTSLTTPRTEQTGTLLPSAETLLAGGHDRYGVLFSAELFQRDHTFGKLTASLQIPRAGHTATMLSDGRVLLLGGLDVSKLPLLQGETFEVPSGVLYDPRAGSFTLLSHALTVPRSEHTATLLPSGLVLVVGGRNEDGVLGSAELFDPETGTSTLVSSTLATPRASHTASLLNDGRVLIAGGKSSKEVLASVEVFDPASQTFTKQRPKLRRARFEHTATVLPNGEILLAGGQLDEDDEPSRRTELYGPPAPDTIPPTVGKISPPHSATQVSRTPLIGIRFSEPINVTRLTASSLTLAGPRGPLAGTVSPGEEGLLAFFIPAGPLAQGTTYTLTLQGITDRAGNPLSTFSSQFTTVLPQPMISSFNPIQGPVGTPVTIFGTNFDATVPSNNTLRFNGTQAIVSTVTPTTITTTVPQGATTGPISVSTAFGTASSAGSFVVIPPPTITGFTPTQGRASTNVTITGQNFDPVPANNQVRFNGASAAVISATSTTLVATVPPTATIGPITVTTASSMAQSTTNFIVVPITAFSVTPALATLPIGATQQVRAIATFADQTTLDVTSFATWGTSNPNVASVTGGGLAQGATQGAATITGTLGSLTASETVQVIAASGGPLPPDPTLVAPPVDRTVATTLGTATAFLYTGSNPVQTGVAPGTIIATRVAVLRGKVSGRDSFPIPGVTITVLNHPEFGQTLTRPDGMFDLAVNGGGQLIVNYAKKGLLSAQRQVDVRWQDYVAVPDVVMVTLDPQVTAVTLTGATTIQVARGSAVTDTDGTRQATLFFAPGTQATMLLPGGGTQPLTTMSVRATEYTVGTTGPQAMPALLPPTSLYTYAVEFSVDEAMTANAMSVQFNPPVISYVENFVNFPIGTTAPLGFYDRQRGQWIASTSGAVVKIVSITSGLADVDTNGDGVADGGVGITTAERQRLATLYTVGQRLWRVPVDHFSAWDINWALRVPLDAISPFFPPSGDQPQDNPCTQTSSVIGCENQTLGESVPLQGTPFRLHYQGDRVPGRKAAFKLDIPLIGTTVPASLRRIDLEIEVAGQRVTQSFPAVANQSTSFTWDGRDAYGRVVVGQQPVKVRVGYAYAASYQETGRFAAIGSGVTLVGNATRFEVTLSKEWITFISPWDSRTVGLGGWSLSAHHAYDPGGKQLYLGTGEKRSAQGLGQVIKTVAGNGQFGSAGDGGPATQAQLRSPFGVAVAPDGTIYIADYDNALIRRVTPDGIITRYAGTGACGYTGDGGPASQAQICNPASMAFAPDGSLYFVDIFNLRIRRIAPDGTISTVAGNGQSGSSGDGGPALQASFGQPGFLCTIAVGPDGSIYLSDNSNNRIRRITPDGIITTVAGNGGTFPFATDGSLATSGGVPFPNGVAVGPDGSVYFVHLFNNLGVRRVGPDGIIHTVAGNGTAGFSGDGGPATAAQLNGPTAVSVGPDGSLYIADFNNGRIRRVAQNGIITTLVGNGRVSYGGDGGLALQAQIGGFFSQYLLSAVIGPDGNLYIADIGSERVRQVSQIFGGLSLSDFAVPSADGSEVYVFNGVGKHLRTLDALTGAVKYQFSYDGNGLLASVTDVAGQVTTIQRDGSGTPTEIVAPGGQRTTLAVDANGYLAAISNPNGETVQLTSSADGLVATLTDPRNGLHQFTYDAQGRLSKDQDPANGFKALARADQSTGWTVALSTALNRTTTYQVENLTTGDLRRKVTDPSGLLTTTLIKTDGTSTMTAPDGTVTMSVQGPDPRFGMQAPILSSLSVRLPSSLTSSLTTTRAVTLSNPNDPLSLTSQTDSLVINGRTYTSTFNQTAKTITTTTPAGRTSTVTLDALGRVVQEQVAGFEAVSYTYDALGRLSTITQGSGTTARTSTLGYDTKNQLTSILDPLSRTVGFSYDLAGRITNQTLPDLRTINYAYDGNGNVTAITPPGKPAHAFAYTPVDLEQNYAPPDAGFSPRNTQYTYNLDRQLTLVTRPDGQTLSLGYDSGGRLSTLTLPGTQTLTYAYSATAGALSTITVPSGDALAYTYDGSLLTNTTWSGTVAGSVTRTYDTNFRISSQSVNGGNTITFGYDNDSLLTSAGSLSITRNAQNGLISGSTLSSVTDSRTYSTFGELGIYTANVSGTPVLDVQYTRDKLGRITQKVETIGGIANTFVYTYDTAGRLTDVNLNGAVVSHYTYDTNGNRLSVTDSTGTVNGTYDAQDRLLTYGNLKFTYTGNGELLTKNNPVLGQTASFTYDVLGNLTAATLPNGTQISYVIDGQNRRIGKKVNGTLVQGFLYQNQLNPVAELDGTGNVVSRFVYGTKANVPDYIIKGGVTYRIVSDHLGSPRLIIDTGTGSVVQRIDYDEFGNITADTNPGFQPFGFAGGLYDQHTGLTRFGARDYDAQIGRWTIKDRVRFNGGDSNLYGYVWNDTVNLIDPFGLAPPRNVPPNVAICTNIAIARQLGPLDFYSKVKAGGDWDFKLKDQDHTKYEDFGNYHFGVVGRAAGFSPETLKRAAGAYQIYKGTSPEGSGWPFGSPPYGDDFFDHAWIDQGIRDFDSGYWEKRCPKQCSLPR